MTNKAKAMELRRRLIARGVIRPEFSTDRGCYEDEAKRSREHAIAARKREMGRKAS